LDLLSLRRVRIGPVRLGDLSEGRVRALTLEELEALW
jgi:16S rRNA U516 pseudouridylate synthase RsuA-like enzyme